MAFASIRRLIASRKLGWLLALALWLPMAQWAAATHTLLHLHASVSEDGAPSGHLPDSCETCVVAATVLGAAPAAEFSAPPATRPAEPEAPAWPAFQLPLAPRAAYHSRAPPLLHA